MIPRSNLLLFSVQNSVTGETRITSVFLNGKQNENLHISEF